MARGFGIGNYGDAYYGVTKYVDASASTSISSGTTSSALKIYQIDGSSSSSSTISVSGLRVRESDLVVSTQSSTASIAFGILAGVSGITVSSGFTSTGQRVRESASACSAEVTSTGLCERIHLSVALSSAVSDSSSGSSVVYQTSSIIDPTASLDVTVVRVQHDNATISANSSLDAVARYKYEVLTKDNESWSGISTGSDTWSNIDQDDESWINIATISSSWTNKPPSGGDWTNV